MRRTRGVKRARRVRYPRPAGHLTKSELAAFLNVDERSIRRWREQGLIPEPGYVTDAGAKCWTPEQVTAILHWRTQKS